MEDSYRSPAEPSAHRQDDPLAALVGLGEAAKTEADAAALLGNATEGCEFAGEDSDAGRAHEAQAEKHAREAQENAEFFGPGTHWHAAARQLRSYVSTLHRHRAQREHARLRSVHGLPRTRSRGAGRPGTRRPARAHAPPSEDGSDDPEPGEAGPSYLDRYLAGLLASSACAAGVPLTIFAGRVAGHCGPAERRELRRLLALLVPEAVAA